MELKYLLFLTPYMIIPLLISHLFRKYQLALRIFSYLLTTIIIILYTLLLQILAMPAPNEKGGYICAPPVMIIIVPLLPIGLVVQVISNCVWKAKLKTNPTLPYSR
jgi:hypothetical protein